MEDVRYEGLYGLVAARAAPEPDVERAIAAVPGAWAESKGGNAVSVHYRQAPDPDAARAMLLKHLAPIAGSSGRRLIEGKLTVELVPDGVPLKGGAVRRLIEEHALRAVLYAGDDLADLEAFEELERARARGIDVIRVAVRGAETPPALLEAADEVVGSPEDLVELLRALVPTPR